MFNKKALEEALLDLGRVLFFAAISWGIAYLTNLPQTDAVVYGTLALKFLDKYIHKNESTDLKGLAPF